MIKPEGVSYMKNVYHTDIMNMLLHSGSDGMSLRQLTRQLYNLHSGIFSSDVVYPQLYNSVRRYLWYQSLQRHSPFVHIRWGRYGLKPDLAVQLDIFVDAPRDEERVSRPVRRDEWRQLLLFPE